jgi:hypothetical protein
MSDLKILILETDPRLTKLTTNSIQKNSPRATWKIVKCGKSKIGTALANVTEPTLVVTSGLILNLKHADLPPLDTVKKYHICASRSGVYVDQKKNAKNYEMIGINMTKGHIDLSVFVINPEKWYEVPASDARILNEKKVLYMPRYMNHRTDPLVATCINCMEAVRYGMGSENAAVFNYVPHILTGKATVRETYAYAFDRLEEYCDGVDPSIRDNVLKLANKSKHRISKLRKGLHDLELALKNPA